MVTREVFWAVPRTLQYYFYAAAGLSVLIFVLGVWSRISVWASGADDKEFKGFGAWDFIAYAVRNFFSTNCILGKKSFQLAAYRGVMLLFIIWSFSTLFLGTLLLTIHHYFKPFLFNQTYYVYSFALDAAGLFFLAGLVIAIARRYIVPEVKRSTSREDLFFLFLFLLIVASGFIVEGMRLAAFNPANMDYSYGGALFSTIVGFIGLNPVGDYVKVWALHVTLVFFLIAYLPFSKFFHVFAAQVSVAAAEKRYGGAIGGRRY